MKERPILYSTPMVRAVLRDENPKSQTRRVEPFDPEEHGALRLVSCAAGVARYSTTLDNNDVYTEVGPRFGVPGDRLWIRERWMPSSIGTIFFADVASSDKRDRWRPSIHLRKVDARAERLVITTHERVERLQDITEEDAKAEGVVLEPCGHLEGAKRPLMLGMGGGR